VRKYDPRLTPLWSEPSEEDEEDPFVDEVPEPTLITVPLDSVDTDGGTAVSVIQLDRIFDDCRSFEVEAVLRIVRPPEW
jgi:hypothetical protein